jgi:hypothetical protein
MAAPVLLSTTVKVGVRGLPQLSTNCAALMTAWGTVQAALGQMVTSARAASRAARAAPCAAASLAGAAAKKAALQVHGA